MKSVIISFSMFLVLLGIMTFSLSHVNKVSSKFRTESDQLEALIKDENWRKAVPYANDMLERWKIQATVIPMFINHAEVDNISSELLKLTQYVETKTKDEALASTHVVKFLLDNIKGLQRVNFQNVF